MTGLVLLLVLFLLAPLHSPRMEARLVHSGRDHLNGHAVVTITITISEAPHALVLGRVVGRGDEPAHARKRGGGEEVGQLEQHVAHAGHLGTHGQHGIQHRAPIGEDQDVRGDACRAAVQNGEVVLERLCIDIEGIAWSPSSS
jgi:hypothetical protein